ncbi:hypothetical protein GCM10023184_41980 [Flaviaesturariibacter amylovorans]|uniref:Uncharacterized protein n=1 Tax=Flaviaesturariibacter amylovorans TaxID=1084520 RepID=A0ABP8HPY3_9BACT
MQWPAFYAEAQRSCPLRNWTRKDEALDSLRTRFAGGPWIARRILLLRRDSLMPEGVHDEPGPGSIPARGAEAPFAGAGRKPYIQETKLLP